MALQQGTRVRGFCRRPVAVHQGLDVHLGEEPGDEVGHLAKFDGAQVAQQLLERRVVGFAANW